LTKHTEAGVEGDEPGRAEYHVGLLGHFGNDGFAHERKSESGKK
jgi:hypothetical protein